MKYYGTFAGAGNYSETLPGAISPQQEFIYSTVYWNPDCEHIEYPDVDNIGLYVGDKFNSNNDFYYDENGAVLNAFNLSHDEDLKKEQIQQILLSCVDKYPQYELELKEGEFPLYINDSVIDRYGGYNSHDREVVRSSHILYIKNYQDFLEKDIKKVI